MKKRQRVSMNQDDEKMMLKDRLTSDLYAKLRAKKSELEAEEKRKKEEEEARKREEMKRREKQKTFEELLNESNLDWRKFK
ncbi:YqkE family protein [Anoxybacteroides tepidamans]|uniref:YqkE family protein n=1 Tax=Anoxybacteroides tepidamans TaxID=265948 RepID=UPI0004858781|nr:YqkE family protein [Anoxybacillus tepidamans]